MSDYYLNHKALAIEYWRDMNKALAENEKLRTERDALRAEVDRLLTVLNEDDTQAALRATSAENETLRAEVIRLTYEKEVLGAQLEAQQAGHEIAVDGWNDVRGQLSDLSDAAEAHCQELQVLEKIGSGRYEGIYEFELESAREAFEAVLAKLVLK